MKQPIGTPRPARVLAALLVLTFAASACTAQDQTTTTQSSEHEHDHETRLEVSYTPAPSLTLEVLKDPLSGWNLHAVVSDFTLAPEHVSTDPIDSEGHMHLYIDGAKITRLYGEWFHLGVLDPGEHQIRVELSANNHLPLAVDGELIDVTVVMTVPGEVSSSASQEIGLTITDGEVTGGGHTEVALGSTVTITATADVADQLHLHGYDIITQLEPGQEATLTFIADVAGIWELELEGSSTVVAHLEVK